MSTMKLEKLCEAACKRILLCDGRDEVFGPRHEGHHLRHSAVAIKRRAQRQGGVGRPRLDNPVDGSRQNRVFGNKM
jgi:hypothetical protein